MNKSKNSGSVSTPAGLERALSAPVGRDAGLQAVIDEAGYPAPRSNKPGFATLARIINSQQLSTSAAASVWAKLEVECDGEVTPQRIINRGEDGLHALGLSRPKSRYIHGLAKMIATETIDIYGLRNLADEKAISCLMDIKGLGRWSAEIYLLLALGRRDIFPAGDLALRKAVGRYLHASDELDEQAVREFAKRWSPYRSAVALLMWKYYGAATL